MYLFQNLHSTCFERIQRCILSKHVECKFWNKYIRKCASCWSFYAVDCDARSVQYQIWYKSYTKSISNFGVLYKILRKKKQYYNCLSKASILFILSLDRHRNFPPGGKATRALNGLVTSMTYSCEGWMELWLHSPIRLYDIHTDNFTFTGDVDKRICCNNCTVYNFVVNTNSISFFFLHKV